jgi:L-seryl-tRNA(Ser) seleniumtransferase
VSGDVVASEATFGGGTSPEKAFASRALSVVLAGLTPDQTAARLRVGATDGGALPVAPLNGALPVIARVERDRVLLDLRSILPEEDAVVAAALAAAATATAAAATAR